MLTIDERVFLALQYAKLESVTLVQRSWKTEYNSKSAPEGKTIKAIYEKFCTTGSVEDLGLHRNGRPKNLEAASECVAKVEQKPSSSLRMSAMSFVCVRLEGGHIEPFVLKKFLSSFVCLQFKKIRQVFRHVIEISEICVA